MNAHTDSDTDSGSPTKTIKVIGFGRRLVATLFDGFLLFVLSFIIATVVGVAGIMLDMYTPNRPIPIEELLIFCGLVVSILYYARAWAGSGETVGKTLMGAKVVGADGQPPSTGRALLRYAGYLLSALVLSLGFVWITFDRKRQGWHDKLAGTFVVPSDAKFSAADAVTFAPSDSRPGWIWLVLWIVVAVVAPGALLIGVWLLGPFVGVAITGWLMGLL